MSYNEAQIREIMPELRGKLRENADLSKNNWFQVGGVAELLFRPDDVADLAYFIKHKPDDLDVTVLGVGSNILIREGGISGVVIRLGRGFADAVVENGKLIAGASCLSLNAALTAQDAELAGVEFLSGIPGSIGGALAMNAGAYGGETADVLLRAELVDDKGNIHWLTKDELGFAYRSCNAPKGWIFTRGEFKTVAGNKQDISERINAITQARGDTQPVRARTGGSTFKNPPGQKAWQLIDRAGCRGLTIGGAQVSEKHCNFLINTGEATAEDLERLGEEVRRRVLEASGIMLEWEIKRIGQRKVRDVANVRAVG